MKTSQQHITLKPKPRGFHLVTDEIKSQLDLSEFHHGTVHLFLQHTSASLAIGENCDASVRNDLEYFFNDIVADEKPYFTHTYEGPDDMPAHIKSMLLGVSLTLPVSHGALALGAWQGIYLNEHRDHANSRHVIVTVIGS